MRLYRYIYRYFAGFMRLFFPVLCRSCGNPLSAGEKVLCLYCEAHLPRTRFHTDRENDVYRIFWGRAGVEFATAFLFFHRGNLVRKLLHDLKYRSFSETGFYLGELFGADLNEDGIFKDVDAIVPVPLHPKKRRKRGYNQSSVIAAGVARALNIPVIEEVLIRNTYSSTQTRKSRMERWMNVKDIFGVVDVKMLEGKHILLIDDVITTGATTEACLQVLQEIDGIRLSVAAIAFATR